MKLEVSPLCSHKFDVEPYQQPIHSSLHA